MEILAMILALPLALFGMSLGGEDDHDDDDADAADDPRSAVARYDAPQEDTQDDAEVEPAEPEPADSGETEAETEAETAAPEAAADAGLFPESGMEEDGSDIARPVALTDFRPGADVLEVSLVEGESPDDLTLAAAQDGSGTLVQIGAATVAVLQGIQPEQIGPDDISLVA